MPNTIANNNKHLNNLLLLECSKSQPDLKEIQNFIHLGADVGVEGNLPILIATDSGNLDLFKCLIECRSNIFLDNASILHKICFHGHANLLTYFIELTGDLRFQKNDILYLTVDYSHIPLIDVIIEHDSYFNNFLLKHAIVSGKETIVKHLFNKYTDLNSHNYELFIYSVQHNNYEMINLIYNLIIDKEELYTTLENLNSLKDKKYSQTHCQSSIKWIEHYLLKEKLQNELSEHTNSSVIKKL